MVKSLVEKPYNIEIHSRWMVARFAEPWAILSWALVNGGWQRSREIAWLYLQIGEIAAVVEPRDWMRAQMREASLSGAVGFLTSRRAGAYVEAAAQDGDVSAWALGTVGLSNALRAGDSSGPIAMPGTINLLVCCSQPLSIEAGLEALALCSEAKALAMLESDVKSLRSNFPASGTGTDYLAICWPVAGERQAYAGKHTSVGAAIGRAAYAAVSLGIHDWVAEKR